ncbi:MAG TPA: glycosyltransferase [Acidimicrobiia bacterium]
MAAALTSVPIGSLPIQRFAEVLPPERWKRVVESVDRAHRVFDGRVIWNINSTAVGGGVAEMLLSLLAYAHGAGVDARWLVISGNEAFFQITKRIHNNLHSAPGDGGPLDGAEREVYESALAPNLAELIELVHPEDVVIVHDPQPAGLIPGLKKHLDVPVIWRCHVGIDVPTDIARRAWKFLIPYVEPADAYVFSRRAFVWEGLDDAKIEVIPPVIDAFSPKNQELDPAAVRAILRVAGFEADSAASQAGEPVFTREDGSPGRVEHRAEIREGGPLRAGDPMVLQVSRWDRLKDPVGVIRGFVDHIAPHTDAHLVYAGPSVSAIADDPEGKEVLDEVYELCDRLSPDLIPRMHLACLPMDDREENAAMVNALQRRANVVVQKSIAEGFGLTVAEAMWKARPVVASRIGGIQDQIIDGVTGVLLDDPFDLAAYGAAVRELLHDPERAERLGRQAQERVRDEFLAVRSLTQYLDLIQRLVGA